MRKLNFFPRVGDCIDVCIWLDFSPPFVVVPFNRLSVKIYTYMKGCHHLCISSLSLATALAVEIKKMCVC